MKYKISFFPDEAEEAAADLAILLRRHLSAKVKRSDAHPPFKHIYLVVPMADKKGCKPAADVV